MFPTASKNLTNTWVWVACICIVLLLSTTSHPLAPIDSLPWHLIADAATIPNIIHYTQLKKDPQSSLEFNFESFLSLYSAVLLLSPNVVYIHTDHDASMIEKARTSGNGWTQKILNSFPNIVKLNEVHPPDTLNGIQVHKEAKSDFVRWEVLFEYGGLYLDWDVLSLRDIAHLRKSGFNSVVGRQPGGSVNSGCVMTQPGSALADIMRREGPLVFDGEWETHSVRLVTTVSERLAGAPAEILILDHKAMAPTGWLPDDADGLFALHDEGSENTAELQILDQTADPMMRWEQRIADRGWKLDFGQTYLLHAFKSRVHDVTGFEEVTVPYVLAQKSNYALAAWLAVDHMVQHGVVAIDAMVT